MHSSRLGWTCTVTVTLLAFTALAPVAAAPCTGDPVALPRQATDVPKWANGELLATEELIYQEAPITFQLDVNGAAAVQLLGPVLDAAADVAREQLPSLMNIQPHGGGPGVNVLGLLVSSAPQLIDPAKDLIKSLTRVTFLGMKPGDSAPLGEVHAYYHQLMTRRGWRPLAALRTESNEGLLLLLAPGGKGLFGVVRPNQRELIVGMVTATTPIGELIAPILRVGGPLLLRTFTAARVSKEKPREAEAPPAAIAIPKNP